MSYLQIYGASNDDEAVSRELPPLELEIHGDHPWAKAVWEIANKSEDRFLIAKEPQLSITLGGVTESYYLDSVHEITSFRSTLKISTHWRHLPPVPAMP